MELRFVQSVVELRHQLPEIARRFGASPQSKPLDRESSGFVGHSVLDQRRNPTLACHRVSPIGKSCAELRRIDLDTRPTA